MAKTTGKTVKEKENIQVYIGPGVGSLGLLRGKIFRGSLPKEVETFIQNNTWMKGLFVPPSRVARATMDARQRGTVEYSLVERLMNILKSREDK